MFRINLKVILLALMTWFTCPAFAGGDLPFPYDQTETLTVVESRMWDVMDSNLLVQLRVYQDKTNSNVQWIRIWIRGDDGYVWYRVFLQKVSLSIDAPVKVDTSAGELFVELAPFGSSHMVLDRTNYKMVPLHVD